MLEHHGMRGFSLEWFSKYSFVWKQYVVYENANSPMLSVEYGVPQGNIVGSILFILFIKYTIGSRCATKIVFYADDTSAFIFDNKLCSLAERVV